MTITLTL